MVTEYYRKAGLLRPLEELGFYLTSYGCSTCIAAGTPVLQANGIAFSSRGMASHQATCGPPKNQPKMVSYHLHRERSFTASLCVPERGKIAPKRGPRAAGVTRSGSRAAVPGSIARIDGSAAGIAASRAAGVTTGASSAAGITAGSTGPAGAPCSAGATGPTAAAGRR